MIVHALPALRREAAVPAGVVFWWDGRPLQVVRTLGTDAAAPVIVAELVGVGNALPGQLALWSLRAVVDAIAATPKLGGPRR
jgi:hypothetical protein